MNKEIRGLNISYEIRGLLNKKVIFLLHGWGSNKELFYNFANFLSDEYKVIMPDFPGFGFSDEPKRPLNVRNYAEILIAFIESFNIKECDILGHSFGGRVIIKIVGEKLRKNFSINKIVLVDSAGIKPKRTIKGRLKVLSFKFYKLLINIFGRKKYKEQLIEELRQNYGSADYKNASEVMRESLKMTVNEDLSKLLKVITNKTIIMWGENDIDTPLSDAKKMNQFIKGSVLFVLKDASHYSFLEKPVEFNNIVRSFLIDG